MGAILTGYHISCTCGQVFDGPTTDFAMMKARARRHAQKMDHIITVETTHYQLYSK